LPGGGEKEAGVGWIGSLGLVDENCCISRGGAREMRSCCIA